MENACLFPAAEPERGGQSADADIWRCAMRSVLGVHNQNHIQVTTRSRILFAIFSDSASLDPRHTCILFVRASCRLSPVARPWGRIGDCDWVLPVPRPCVHPHLHTHTSPSPRHMTGSRTPSHDHRTPTRGVNSQLRHATPGRRRSLCLAVSLVHVLGSRVAWSPARAETETRD